MKFLAIYTPDADRCNDDPLLQQRMGELIEQGFREGYLLSTGGLMPRGGARLQRRGSQIAVIDGPYSEAKEVIAGYALIQAESTQAAIEYSRRFLAVAGDGNTELHLIAEGDPA